MKPVIYLDYAATTPVDPRVAEKMSQFLTRDGTFANPASMHSLGLGAKKAIEEARLNVAELIHADSNEIIWTSGATESNNLAIKGTVSLYQRRGKHIITLKTEHPSVLDCCQQLEKQGFLLSYLQPEANGLLNTAHLESAIRPDTILVSIMHVNNETGVIQDIKKISEITSSRGILLHVDAAQSAGKIPLNVQHIPVDLISLCAHKVYGPKGIGALYVRRKPRIRVASQMHGGGQEQGMRSGTLATHQIVGMGEAFSMAKQMMSEDFQKIQTISSQFWTQLSDRCGQYTILRNIETIHAVPHIVNIRFPRIKAKTLVEHCPSLIFSAGSACHAKSDEPSYVLRALGLTEEEAHCSVRFSFGRFTTSQEINMAADIILSYLKKDDSVLALNKID